MRVAIVHHWFVTRGGGERVAACIASLFPQAELFTLLAGPRGLPESLRTRTLHTSLLQRIPGATRVHRHLMPLYPAATESLNLRGFDLVLSSDSGPVKGVRLEPGAVHICYCHSPMRYLYDGFEPYRAAMSGLVRLAFTAFAGRLRAWDRRAAERVDAFIANSQHVQERISRLYGRESEVIYPPIALELARVASQPGDHYLCAGRLVGYKRTELMVAACTRMGRPLRVAGTGPELDRLRRFAGPGITFTGELSTEALWAEYAQCRALLFAADEDFGMVPVEAQACGRPVVCFGQGGSLETVKASGPDPTGVYFAEQTVESVMEGIREFEAREQEFSVAACQAWAGRFSTQQFLTRLRAFVLARVPAAAAEMVFPGE